MKFMRRFASSWAKTSNATVIEEGSFFGHVHMAKEIWPFNEFGNDGTGGRETEATVQCKRLDGGNLENCRNENVTIASKFRTRTSCTSSVTTFRSTWSALEQTVTATAPKQCGTRTDKIYRKFFQVFLVWPWDGLLRIQCLWRCFFVFVFVFAAVFISSNVFSWRPNRWLGRRWIPRRAFRYVRQIENCITE